MSDLSRFVNVPYAEADCWELARRVLLDQGIAPPAYCYDDTQQTRRAALRRARPDWQKVPHGRALDVAVFNTPAGLHVGVIVARGQFLHADREGGRSRVERLTAPEWSSTLEGVYRYAGH